MTKSNKQETVLITGPFGEERIGSGPMREVGIIWSKRREEAMREYEAALLECVEETLKQNYTP